MLMKIDLSGMTCVEGELWICGGKSSGEDYKDAKSCTILNLFNGTYSVLPWKMNKPRLNPIVTSAERSIMVIGGHTSDFESRTGCRDTMEVFDMDNPDEGWRLKNIAENIGCKYEEGERVFVKC